VKLFKCNANPNPPPKPFRRITKSHPCVYFGEGRFPAAGETVCHTLQAWQLKHSFLGRREILVPPPGCQVETARDLEVWSAILKPPYTHFVKFEYSLLDGSNMPPKLLLSRAFNLSLFGVPASYAALEICTYLEFVARDKLIPYKMLYYGFESQKFGFWLLAVQRKCRSLSLPGDRQ
jgi:hypothetical protein